MKNQNDPRLTALALGELGPKEAEDLRRELEFDPEAGEFVRDVKDIQGLLEKGLAHEPAVPGRKPPKQKRQWVEFVLGVVVVVALAVMFRDKIQTALEEKLSALATDITGFTGNGQ